jgi:hypothetical protein
MPRSSNLTPSIPAGYVVIKGPNGQQYLVPRFMVFATEQAIEAEQQKIDVEIGKADKGVRTSFFSLICY